MGRSSGVLFKEVSTFSEVSFNRGFTVLGMDHRLYYIHYKQVRTYVHTYICMCLYVLICNIRILTN